MTLRLLLLRHAKSSWTDPGLDDRDRPLNPRGIKAAAAIGRYMLKEDLIPELVLCSPARRARETWRLAAEQLKNAPRLLIEDAIYDFGNGGRVLDALRQHASNERSVLIVGHNPSLERLALRIAPEGDREARHRMEQKFPTGGLAVIDFRAENWRDASNQQGVLVSFIRPRDLGGSE